MPLFFTWLFFKLSNGDDFDVAGLELLFKKALPLAPIDAKVFVPPPNNDVLGANGIDELDWFSWLAVDVIPNNEVVLFWDDVEFVVVCGGIVEPLANGLLKAEVPNNGWFPKTLVVVVGFDDGSKFLDGSTAFEVSTFFASPKIK